MLYYATKVDNFLEYCAPLCIFRLRGKEQSPTPSAPATPPKPSIAERAQARHNARTPQQIADIQKRWDERREKLARGRLKAQRKQILSDAKATLLGSTIEHLSMTKPIHFTTTGLKEAINQPHKHYEAKNNAIMNIIKRIQMGEYIGYKTDNKGRNALFHYITTEIAGEPSLIVLKEQEGRVTFYSIVEKA